MVLGSSGKARGGILEFSGERFEVSLAAAGQAQPVSHDLEVDAASRHDVDTPKRSCSIARWRGSNSAAFRVTTNS